MKRRVKISALLNWLILFFGMLIIGSVSSLYGQNAPSCGTVLASYKSVPAYSNGMDQWYETDCDPNNTKPPYGAYGEQFQCTEYVKRFYSKALSIAGASQWTGDAIDYSSASWATPKGLAFFVNAGPVSPEPDDILTFAGPNDEGHVAIITSMSDPNSSNPTITFIEQNWSIIEGTSLPSLPYSYSCNSSGCSYTVSDRRSIGSNGEVKAIFQVQGWVRSTAAVIINPTPTISSLNPNSLPPGSAPQTLAINGTGFLKTSTVTLNGVAHAPTYVNPAKLTISLSTADLSTVGTFPLVVANPAPGGGLSAPAIFTVMLPSTITMVSASCSPTIVSEGQTSQCVATVRGIGNFDPTVTWLASLGTIVPAAGETATYTAPSSSTGPAVITATASEDITKSGFATLIITRTLPSGSWQRTGPLGGGDLTVLAEDPGSPSTIYAGGDNAGAGGLWMSTDAGTTWTAIVTNSVMDYYPISDIAVVNGGQTIYASSSHAPYFFWSADAGATWNQAQAGTNGSSIGGMAVDPKNNSIIYLSDAGIGVLRSVDGGVNWTMLATSPVITAGSATALLHQPIQVDPTNTGTVYYGTDHGLYITKDGGMTWSASTNGIASADTAVRDIAIDPAAPSSIFALAGLPSSTVVDLYQSTNGGNSWTPLAIGLDAERVVPDPTTASTIYLYGLQLHAAYKSTNGGLTFEPSDTGTPSGGSSGYIVLSGPTGTMIPLTSMPDAFLLTIGGSGIYKTLNSDQSWSYSSAGISAWNGDALAVDPEVPTTIYFGALNGGGIFKSTDGGLTWANLLQDTITDIAVDPFDSTHLLAASLSKGLIQSHDGGDTWTNISSTLPPPSSGQTAVITGIYFHPQQQGTIFIPTVGGGVGLLRSSDGGNTFITANAGLSSTDVGGCLAVNPQDRKMLLMTDGVGLATSTDGGNTWVETTSSVVCPFSVDLKSNPTVVYAAAPPLSSNTYAYTAVRSLDFGKTWTSLNVAAPLIADPSTANSVFSVNSWSPDAGTTWYPLLTGNLGQSLLEPGGLEYVGQFASGTGMIIAPSSPQVMFIASWTNALLRFVVGP